MSPELKTKILATFNSLNQGLVERESVLKVALLTVLAGENLLLIGPPGTAKSLIARRVAEALTPKNENNHYFEYLLTKFSTPEEIFGPLSITALKADCFKRNTVGYLPTVQIAFLDEIFKASSSILNALLTILNERIYHNGAELQRVPLQALIAASNELPTGQDELSALYDRFLLRVFVDYVSLDSLPLLFEKTPDELSSLNPFTVDELAAIQQAAQAVTIPSEVVQAIQQIWQKHREIFKEDMREQLSDRRLKKVIKLLRVAAATNGRDQVNLSDIVLLKDCLWNHPDNALKVHGLISEVLTNFSYPVPQASEPNNAATPVKSASKSNVVKGYKGSGTKTDPILISTVDDIAGLERAEVGQQGYYFKQTADIDCSRLTTWPNINFQGHYDGGGYAVSYSRLDCFLFEQIQTQSTIMGLCVQKLRLASSVSGSEIVACTAIDSSLIESATNSKLTACKAKQHIIIKDATKCVIVRSQSGYPLIGSVATDTQINDCIVILDLNSDKLGDRSRFGGIALQLYRSTVDTSCVTGSLKSTGLNNVHSFSRQGYIFAGIADECISSTIHSCALGKLKIVGNSFKLSGRFIRIKKDTTVLQNNIAIDSVSPAHGGSKDEDGKSLSTALFNQHYFEHTLGWDFNKIWQWNSSLNRPQLQSVGVGAVAAATELNSDDLLYQQMYANIWL